MSLVVCENRNGIGVITLNRPESLNALNLEMFQLLEQAFEVWREASDIHMVVLQGAGPKAFCAGGDIRALYEAMGTQDWAMLEQFYRYEYLIDGMIGRYPKPCIALGQGITMGGGMGITMPCPYRIVSETSLWAMPETKIGFFPDVGAARFLNDCPGAVGMYLALTGNTMNAADALYAGVATHFIVNDTLDVLLETLVQADTARFPAEILQEALTIFASVPDMPCALQEEKRVIDLCFGQPSVEKIIHELEGVKGQWAKDILRDLDARAPMSLKVTHAFMTRARKMPIDQVLKMDYQLACAFSRAPDFQEGIRALLIDRDRLPQWRPPALDQVTEAMVNNYFQEEA